MLHASVQETQEFVQGQAARWSLLLVDKHELTQTWCTFLSLLMRINKYIIYCIKYNKYISNLYIDFHVRNLGVPFMFLPTVGKYNLLRTLPECHQWKSSDYPQIPPVMPPQSFALVNFLVTINEVFGSKVAAQSLHYTAHSGYLGLSGHLLYIVNV